MKKINNCTSVHRFGVSFFFFFFFMPLHPKTGQVYFCQCASVTSVSGNSFQSFHFIPNVRWAIIPRNVIFTSRRWWWLTYFFLNFMCYCNEIRPIRYQNELKNAIKFFYWATHFRYLKNRFRFANGMETLIWTMTIILKSARMSEYVVSTHCLSFWCFHNDSRAFHFKCIMKFTYIRSCEALDFPPRLWIVFIPRYCLLGYFGNLPGANKNGAVCTWFGLVLAICHIWAYSESLDLYFNLYMVSDSLSKSFV